MRSSLYSNSLNTFYDNKSPNGGAGISKSSRLQLNQTLYSGASVIVEDNLGESKAALNSNLSFGADNGREYKSIVNLSFNSNSNSIQPESNNASINNNSQQIQSTSKNRKK